jgi:hypothetical protein
MKNKIKATWKNCDKINLAIFVAITAIAKGYFYFWEGLR